MAAGPTGRWRRTRPHFIGTANFDGVAGELHYHVANGVTVVEGDANGDCHADFQIELTGAYQLTDLDFVL
jgi:hypothetical protein